MNGALFLNSMQSFDFESEISKQAAMDEFEYDAAAAVNYTLLELTRGGSVGAQSFQLDIGSYATLAATALAGSGTAVVNGNLTLTLLDVSAVNLFLTNTVATSAVKVVGTVTLAATGGTFGAMFIGGINSSEAEVAAVAVTLTNTAITSAFYGNGMSTNLGTTNINLTGVTAGGYFYGGTGSYNADYSTGVIVVNFKSGTYTAQVYGGSRVGGDGSAKLDSTNQTVTLNLSGGTFSNYVFAGGCGVGGGTAGSATITSTVVNGTYVNLTGALVTHEIYAGGYGALAHGIAVVNGGTNVVAKGGSAVNLYGGGYCYGESSIVNGGSILSIRGFGYREGTAALTIGTVYGGGNGASPAAAGSSIVNGGSYITIGGNTLTVNVITVTNVYGGGNGATSLVNDGSTIVFSGNFSGTSANRLSVSGVVSGSGRNSGVVSGTKLLQFDDFQGTLGARFMNFDKVVADGYTQAVFSRAADFSGVSDMHFNFAQGEPLSSSDNILSFAGGVTFGEDTIFSLSFEARSAMETNYTLIWSGESLDLTGKTYKLTDSLYGDTFTAKLGDGASWNYYGYSMSMTLENLPGNSTLTFNCYKIA